MQKFNYKNNKQKNSFGFKNYKVGDWVKFKGIRPYVKEKMKQGIYIDKKYVVYYGKIVDTSRNDFLGIFLNRDTKCMDFPKGLTIWVDKRAILQIYPQKLVKHITPRLALKHIWKDLIFREVKTTKSSNIKAVYYNYINNSGFPRTKKFSSYEDALRNVEPNYHRNILLHYDEYFGFTGDRVIRNNDPYYDKEIFFSKKCYSELDWSDKNPTGDFLLNERAFNHVPPKAGSLICGLVENGEKGLFFRKWFVCSREFLLLWTMICDHKDHSLIENNITKLNFENIQNEEDITKKIIVKIKPFDKLLRELSTSKYKIDLKKDLKERQRKYTIYNLERGALYYSNRYRKVAEIIFTKGQFLNHYLNSDSKSYSDDYKDEYTPFQKRLIRNILWQK